MDSYNRVLYELNYGNMDLSDLEEYLEYNITLYKEHPLLVEKRETKDSQTIFFVIIANKNSNEIFVHNALCSFLENCDKIMKNGWSMERFETKFDLFIQLTNQFLFKGIILEDNKEKLEERQLKRSFESIGGIKVNKGLASMLNKAAKSMKNSFSLNK